MKKIIVVVLILIALGALGLIFEASSNKVVTKITSFADCEKAGFPILESYPRQCVTKDGQHFTEIIDEKNLNTDPVIISPDISKPIGSPITITGEARGNWFFEASFPAKLVDSKNKVIATSTAKAKSDWMTENFVPFEIKFTFKEPETAGGFLILQKDNPSGLAANNREIKIPILFQGRHQISPNLGVTDNKGLNEATSSASSTSSTTP